MPLGEFRFTFPEPTLFIQTIHGGNLCHQESYPRADLIYQPGYDCFRRAETIQVIPLIVASAASTMTALLQAEAVLVQLISDELAAALIGRLGLETLPAVRVVPIPLAVSAPLQAALSPELQGTLQRSSAQSKVLEYLCALCRYTAPRVRESHRPSLQHPRERIAALHDYLKQLEGQLPSLENLAVRFGLSARRLNAAFAEHYGLPIYAFIADWRLKEAYGAICDSDEALKVLASRLGYSHVNHFNRAFRRKCGYPPGQLRYGRRGEGAKDAATPSAPSRPGPLPDGFVSE